MVKFHFLLDKYECEKRMVTSNCYFACRHKTGSKSHLLEKCNRWHLWIRGTPNECVAPHFTLKGNFRKSITKAKTPNVEGLDTCNQTLLGHCRLTEVPSSAFSGRLQLRKHCANSEKHSPTLHWNSSPSPCWLLTTWHTVWNYCFNVEEFQPLVDKFFLFAIKRCMLTLAQGGCKWWEEHFSRLSDLQGQWKIYDGHTIQIH